MPTKKRTTKRRAARRAPKRMTRRAPARKTAKRRTSAPRRAPAPINSAALLEIHESAGTLLNDLSTDIMLTRCRRPVNAVAAEIDSVLGRARDLARQGRIPVSTAKAIDEEARVAFNWYRNTCGGR